MDIEYVENRDLLIPDATRAARSIAGKLRLRKPDATKDEYKRVYASVFSSAMDSFAFAHGITKVKPRKPLSFWEQESERWKGCGKALQT